MSQRSAPGLMGLTKSSSHGGLHIEGLSQGAADKTAVLLRRVRLSPTGSVQGSWNRLVVVFFLTVHFSGDMLQSHSKSFLPSPLQMCLLVTGQPTCVKHPFVASVLLHQLLVPISPAVITVV